MGVQIIMVFYVESRVEVQVVVDVMCYGLCGICGMVGMICVMCFGQVEDYFIIVEEEFCLIVQVEIVKGMVVFEEIVGVDGVDVVFIGLVDLSVSMGYSGQFDYFEVVKIIEQVFECCNVIGMFIGLMDLDVVVVKCWIVLGLSFIVVVVD